jgi:hypothetical protein
MIGTIIFMLVILVILSFLAAVNLFIASISTGRIENDLLQHGVHSTGHIMGDIYSRRIDSPLPYNYEYEEKKYTCKQRVSKRYKDTLYRGVSVDIIHLPDKPKVAMIASIEPAYRQSRIYRRSAYRGVIYLCISLPLLIVLLLNFH